MPYAPSGMSREPYHPPALHRGRSYDLSHLNPFVFEAASAKMPRPLRVNVRFTNHCYSEAFDPTRHAPEDPTIQDGVRRRVFAPERYALSQHLPGLIRGLASPGTRVHETAARRNWMYAAAMEIPVTNTRYQIFFELRRTMPERRRFQDLDMVVESAYPADPNRPAPNVLGRMNFLLLAGSVYLGVKTSTRR
jgi:hypothetical protein